MPWAFGAMLGVQQDHGLASQCSQALNTGLSTRRALVDGRLPFGHGAGIAGAIGKAATCALRLRQGIVEGKKKRLGLRRCGLQGHGPQALGATQVVLTVPCG